MLQQAFKIILRRLQKNKTATFINFGGLTVGLATAMLIFIYVYNEWQTDRSLPHPERTFRVLRVSEINNEPYDIGITSAPFAPALKEDFSSDVEDAVRVLDGNSIVALGDRRFEEDKYFYADPNFLTFFDFPLLYGDAKTALSNVNTVVLTRQTARRYFGDEKEAMGKTIRVDNSYDALITGVLEEQKAPIHLDFDL